MAAQDSLLEGSWILETAVGRERGGLGSLSSWAWRLRVCTSMGRGEWGCRRGMLWGSRHHPLLDTSYCLVSHCQR